MPETAPSSSDWPGKRLGLPAEGPRSVARLGRRLAAFAIDWAPAYLLASVFFAPNGVVDGFAILAIYAVSQIIFLATANGSLGHLIMRMRVVPVAGGYLGVWRPVVRTLLICLVIPAVIWDTDQRGLHDRAAGTVLVRV